MDWTQLAIFIATMVGFIATMAGFFLWSRAETRTDIRTLEDRIDHYRLEMSSRFDLQRQESHNLLVAIQKEMQDFHGRLCALEEKYKQIERKA